MPAFHYGLKFTRRPTQHGDYKKICNCDVGISVVNLDPGYLDIHQRKRYGAYADSFSLAIRRSADMSSTWISLLSTLTICCFCRRLKTRLTVSRVTPR